MCDKKCGNCDWYVANYESVAIRGEEAFDSNGECLGFGSPKEEQMVKGTDEACETWIPRVCIDCNQSPCVCDGNDLPELDMMEAEFIH